MFADQDLQDISQIQPVDADQSAIVNETSFMLDALKDDSVLVEMRLNAQRAQEEQDDENYHLAIKQIWSETDAQIDKLQAKQHVSRVSFALTVIVG